MSGIAERAADAAKGAIVGLTALGSVAATNGAALAQAYAPDIADAPATVQMVEAAKQAVEAQYDLNEMQNHAEDGMEGLQEPEYADYRDVEPEAADADMLGDSEGDADMLGDSVAADVDGGVSGDAGGPGL